MEAVIQPAEKLCVETFKLLHVTLHTSLSSTDTGEFQHSGSRASILTNAENFNRSKCVAFNESRAEHALHGECFNHWCYLVTD